MTFRALLKLARIPNVFTAFANAIAGVLIVRAGAFELRDLLLVLASGALYVAGMVLNDFFDRRVDAVERPGRPIPAGEVGAGAAALLGGVLMAAGIGLSALHNPRSLAVALGLSVAILIYDGAVKSTLIGPFAMASCRFLNVLLGLSAAWPEGLLWLQPLAMGLFTLFITVLSRDEVLGGGLERVRVVVLGLALAAVLLAGSLVPFSAMTSSGGKTFGLACALPFLLYLVVRGVQNFRPLWHDASGPIIGRSIGGGILLMPAIDATFVAAAGIPLGALLVIALTVPAAWLKRWYYLT